MKILIWTLVAMVTITLGAAICLALFGRYDPGVGLAGEENPSSVSSPALLINTDPEDASSYGSMAAPLHSGAEAGTSFYGQVHRKGDGAPSEARMHAGSSPALATLLEYEESFLPTEEGLYDMTVGVWDNPDFLDLTQDEAHALLGLDDSFGFSGPGTILSIAGPLPTEEDCRSGFRSSRVRALLQQTCAYEIMLVEIGGISWEKRSADYGVMLSDAIRARDAAMSELMRTLESETGFKSWRLWYRLHKEWSHGS